MPRRGPPPNPNAVRRNKREITGTVTVARPTMPSDLAVEAKAEWRRVVPELERMGRLTKLDRALLIRYCSAWGDWRSLDADIAKTGRLVKGQKGNLVRNPLWLMRRDAEQTVTELARQLGLSPDSRLRAGITHQAPQPKETERPADVTDLEAERKRRLLNAG